MKEDSFVTCLHNAKKQLQEAISVAGLYGFTVEYLKKEFLEISEGRFKFVIFLRFKFVTFL